MAAACMSAYKAQQPPMKSLQHGLDRRGAARLTTGLALALALHTASPRKSASRSSSGAPSTLTATLLLPAVALSLTPLYARRLCDVPLAQTLSQPQRPEAGVQTGYLTMDQARSLLPLAADDSNVYSVPLVGVWVRGVRKTEHPLVYATALQFAYATALPDRAVQPDGAFLLLLFSGEGPVPRCYEARFTDPSAQPQPWPHGHDARSALLSPAGGSNSSSNSVTGAAVGVGGSSGFGCGGLRVLPYVLRAELAAQTAAPLELKPVMDSVTAATAARCLTLPPSSTTTTTRAGVSSLGHLGARPASPAASAAAGSVSKYDAYGTYSMYHQLRGSGSKLMTSPSKAMKILAGEGAGMTAIGGSVSGYAAWAGVGTASGAAATAVAATSATGWSSNSLYGGTGGQAAANPWAAAAAAGPSAFPGVGAQRDSPPVPRSSAVPTPFRLQQRAAAAEPRDEHSASAAGAGTHGERSAWVPVTRGPVPPSQTTTAAAAGPVAATGAGDLPVLPAVRVSAVPAAAAAPSRAGSTDWSDPANGVMGTPAAALARRDSQFLAATPGLPYDPAGPYSHLQQQIRIAGAEAEQQQQQQSQQPGAWGAGGGAAPWMASGMMPASARSSRPWSSGTTTAATAEPAVPQQQAHHNFRGGAGDNQHGQVSAASSSGRQPAPGPGSSVSASAACGTGSASGSGACWRMHSAAGGAGAGGHGEAAASQSLDGWLRASGRVASTECGLPLHASTAPGDAAPAAAAPRQAAACAPAAVGLVNGGLNGYGVDVSASAPHNGAAGSRIAAAVAQPPLPALSRPASADPYRPHPQPWQNRGQQQQQSRPAELGGAQSQAWASGSRCQSDGHENGGVELRAPAHVQYRQPEYQPYNQHPTQQRNQDQQQSLARQIVFPDDPEVVSEMGLADLEDDNLPMDPVLLRREVVRLRRQVHDLQRQLHIVAAGAPRLPLTSGRQEMSQPSQPSLVMEPQVTCRLAASAVSTTAAAAPQLRPADPQTDAPGRQRSDVTPAAEESTSSGRPCQQWQARQPWQQQQRQGGGAPAAPPVAAAGLPPALPASDAVSGPAHPCGATTATATAALAVAVLSRCPANSAPGHTTAAAVVGVATAHWPQQPAGCNVGAAADAEAAGDRVERMSVVSEAASSDRGSVWSMASLRSSIVSHHLCRSQAASRSPAEEGASAGNGDAPDANVGGPSIQPGGAVGLRDDYGGKNEPCSMSEGGSGGQGGGASARSGCCDEAMGTCSGTGVGALAELQQQALVASGRPHVHEYAGLGDRPAAAPGPRAAAALGGARSHGGLAGGTGRLQPSPLHAGLATGRPWAPGQLGRTPQPWDWAVGSAGKRGRRRARRSSSDSDSDSDHSLPSEPEDMPVAPRPSTAPSRAAAEAPTAAGDRIPLWKPHPTGAATVSNSGNGVSSSCGWPTHAHGHGQPRASAPAAPSPRTSSGGGGSSLAGVGTGVVAGAVVRTKYIPLEDDSDSSDSESELLLMQKYGISAL
ncbi:hypothetical protein PLESTB_001450900 [Pleodorina starrii]|uniref:STIL N-terminal domain-containing protein n=1 Tax=Pleodorina starrii TaxID=330485 RepID=A0A9W6BVS0_9CHLO|nr:hypothetical protein PLESTB_001450900 [Pleodorina starrii]